MREEQQESVVTESERSTFEWARFLEAYADGDYPLRSTPIRPLAHAAATGLPDVPSTRTAWSTPLYPPNWREDINAVADKIQRFCLERHVLPPPRSQYEEERIRVIDEYRLLSPEQRKVGDRVCSLAALIFKDKVVSLSLFQNSVQEVLSANGCAVPDGLEGAVVPYEDGICSHVVLRRDSAVVEICNTEEDWRFEGNQFVHSSTGWIKGYAGQPVLLPVNAYSPPIPGQADDRPKIVIGVIGLLSRTPMVPLTETEIGILGHLADICSRDWQSLMELWIREREGDLRASVSEFLNTTLVHSSVLLQTKTNSSETRRDRTEIDFAEESLDRLAKHLQADGCFVVDVSSLTAFEIKDAHAAMPRSEGDNDRLTLVASRSTSRAKLDIDAFITNGYQAVLGFLHSYSQNGQNRFDGANGLSGLEHLLPANVTAHVMLPFYTNTRPHLLVVVFSVEPSYVFTVLDVAYASNISSILLALFVRIRLEKADAAKTAFVSQISHELRTPLHGLLSHVDLIRSAIASNDIASTTSLLDTAEFCGLALRDILEDVLESSKLTHAVTSDSNDNHSAKSVVDMSEILLQTAKMCASRQDLTSNVAAGESGNNAASVSLIVEIEDRSPDTWRASIQTASFRRILLNLIQNALKYTKEGQVLVSLRIKECTLDSKSDTTNILLSVKDTGVGIKDSFKESLFEPFVQASNFSSGAGLGLFITRAIIQRMEGSISVSSVFGKGSTFSVELPVQLLQPAEALKNHKGTLRTVITDPKAAQFTPQASPLIASPSTGNGSKSELDLSRIRLLIADDNVIGRRILVNVARKHAINFVEACDGQESLDLFKTFRPHAVWTDVSMPRLNGIESAAKMRQYEAEHHLAKARITVLTGLGSSDVSQKDEALQGEAAVDEWLVKGKVKLSGLVDDLVEIANRNKEHREGV